MEESNMKKIIINNNKAIGKIAGCKAGLASLALAATLSLTSCDDFLTITPSDQIVEEDFWEDKSDLQNVMSACYTRYVNMLTQLMQWGEMRSDNFTLATGVTNNPIKNTMNANLLPNYSIFDWTDLYNEINFCNKVLAHGDEIVAKDESFSQGDWEPIKAEAMTLRALSHFYLVRVWGEVPYVTTDYNNDSQDFLTPQSSQQAVLDSIISELEIAKDLAMNDYGQTVWNKGRVTKKAVYALLADVYLWRASKNASADSVAIYGNQSKEDYQKCIDCCDWVIEQMTQDRVEDLNKNGKVLGGVKTSDLTIEDLLIPNERSVNNKYFTDSEIGAFSRIFGSGNSMESIFELQIDGTNNSNSVNTYFWNISKSTVGTFTGSDPIFNTVISTPNDLAPTTVFSKTDYRRWETLRFEKVDQLTFPIYKFNVTDVTQYNGSGATSVMQDNSSTSNFHCTQSPTRSTSTNSCNWIFYRLSDMMLMKAEAMSQLYDDEEHLKEAFQLCRHIFKRSNPYAYATNNSYAKNDSLNFEVFNTQEGVEALVMAERQREFIGEGKRWFDLVRYAQRKASTSDMLKKYLGRKYSENKNAVSAKLATITSLFSPIYINQMKANKYLHQNSVWNANESTSKTDDL